MKEIITRLLSEKKIDVATAMQLVMKGMSLDSYKDLLQNLFDQGHITAEEVIMILEDVTSTRQIWVDPLPHTYPTIPQIYPAQPLSPFYPYEINKPYPDFPSTTEPYWKSPVTWQYNYTTSTNTGKQQEK